MDVGPLGGIGVSLPEYEVAIVGSGFAGLGMAIELRRSGEENFVVLERSPELGGTWRENHYPGCACDVPTPLYSYSFAPNPKWSHLYARSGEIRDYLERCADRFGVRGHLRFETEVTGGSWDAEGQRWEVEIDGEPALRARFVVGGFGGLQSAIVPGHRRPGKLRWAPVPFRPMESRREPEGQARRRDRHGRQLDPVDPADRARASHVSVFQRTPPWIVPEARPADRSARAGALATLPLTQQAMRG